MTSALQPHQKFKLTMNEEEFIAKLKETAGLMQADGVEPYRIQQFIDQKKRMEL